MRAPFPPPADGQAVLLDRQRHRTQRSTGVTGQSPHEPPDPSGADGAGRSRGGGPDGCGIGDAATAGWAPPPDAAPERTALALARWQRRRTVRALLGRPSNEIGPREGIRGAALCGVLLGVVAKVVVFTVGAWP